MSQLNTPLSPDVHCQCNPLVFRYQFIPTCGTLRHHVMQMAHETLVAAWRECQGCEAAILEELRAALVLLHSYILIKPLVRLGDHKVCDHPASRYGL